MSLSRVKPYRPKGSGDGDAGGLLRFLHGPEPLLSLFYHA